MAFLSRYNRVVKSGVVFAIALAAIQVSCGNKMQTREAVERGVLKGVASRGINADSMDVSVTHVDFHGKQADAVVSFAPKGGKISDGLTMRYTLEQRGNEWVIVNRSAMNMQQHTGGMQSPPSVMDQNSGAVDPMPNALPGIAPSSRPLPPGHPPLNGTSK